MAVLTTARGRIRLNSTAPDERWRCRTICGVTVHWESQQERPGASFRNRRVSPSEVSSVSQRRLPVIYRAWHSKGISDLTPESYC